MERVISGGRIFFSSALCSFFIGFTRVLIIFWIFGFYE